MCIFKSKMSNVNRCTSCTAIHNPLLTNKLKPFVTILPIKKTVPKTSNLSLMDKHGQK